MGADKCIDCRDILGVDDRENDFLAFKMNSKGLIMGRVISVYSVLLHYINPSNSKYERDSFKLICGGISGFIHNPRVQLLIFKERPHIIHVIIAICFYFP